MIKRQEHIPVSLKKYKFPDSSCEEYFHNQFLHLAKQILQTNMLRQMQNCR